MLNAGQTCIAPTICWSKKKSAKRSEAEKNLPPGKDVQNGDLPRIINDRQFDRLQAYIDAHLRGALVQ